MPVITIDVFAPVDSRLPQLAVDAVEALAETHLHFDRRQTLTQVRFAAPDESWFFRARPLDRATEPAFHIVACIIKANTTGLERGEFLSQALTELKEIFSTIYHVRFPEDFDERNKITLLDIA
ncbi:hypothetical protein [Brevifollis gellanilyticus]|uniref:4-oxalocrotonate tautomerase domain-containing protein n=1 Tax=Brevifollis gellanilyticus TaxID=748831 RepID=A0A512MCM8_9BACT|nr:hypothetical protein [Brevifollis gellanilyticus]GEP44487.1 hypothetical protein BGE01nite_37780 [Brevifollis gellanilyticus]